MAKRTQLKARVRKNASRDHRPVWGEKKPYQQLDHDVQASVWIRQQTPLRLMPSNEQVVVTNYNRHTDEVQVYDFDHGKRWAGFDQIATQSKNPPKRKNFGIAETALTLGAIQSARDLGLGRALTRKTNPLLPVPEGHGGNAYQIYYLNHDGTVAGIAKSFLARNDEDAMKSARQWLNERQESGTFIVFHGKIGDPRNRLRTVGRLRNSSTRNPEDIEFLNDLAPSTSLGHLEFTPDGIERYVRDGYVYRAFSNTQVFADGYRMGSVEGEVMEMPELQTPMYPAETFPHLVNPKPKILLGRDGTRESANERARDARLVGFTSVRVIKTRGAYETVADAIGKKRNPGPASDAVYEEFHGTAPSETLEIVEDLRVHGHLAGLGDLVHVVVELAAGTKEGKQLQLNAPDPAKASDSDIVRLTSNEDKSQLYFTGGDQQLDLQSLGFRKSFDIVHDGEHYDATDIKDLMVIGPIVRVMYRTEKAFDDFESIDYHHLHGEDTKKYPTLLYDTLNDRMLTAGGEYAISPAGIVN